MVRDCSHWHQQGRDRRKAEELSGMLLAVLNGTQRIDGTEARWHPEWIGPKTEELAKRLQDMAPVLE